VDGVSLTVNEVTDQPDGTAHFALNIIPHTAEVTTLGRLAPATRLISRSTCSRAISSACRALPRRPEVGTCQGGAKACLSGAKAKLALDAYDSTK
jgi:hypothetical protein